MTAKSYSFSGADEFLNKIPMFGNRGISAADFNLEKMYFFCRQMGNPEKTFRSVHVAGTNGKGTVCRLLASVYHSAGYKTGLYTSPHLIGVRERFMINGEMISEHDFARFFTLFADRIRSHTLTYFEITTALAFWYFSEKKVDIAIIETGLGGRLDATNVITPEVCVITSIGLDHTDILGETIPEIAAEKAGIIKHGVPVVTGKLPKEAMNVIQNKCRQTESQLHQYNEGRTELEKDNRLAQHPGIGLVTDRINKAAVDTVKNVLSEKLPVTDAQFVDGISQMAVRYKKRGSFSQIHPDFPWYFDGAHNVEAVKILSDHMSKMAPPEMWTVVFSSMRDKLKKEITEVWKPYPNFYIYQMDSERAATTGELKEKIPQAITLDEAELLKGNLFKTELVIFTGSFYFYNVVSKWMGTIIASK